MMQTGIEVRQGREMLGLSQAKLAEVAGISQHLLSAFELGKIALAKEDLRRVNFALKDDGKIDGLVKRKKRYQKHSYIAMAHSADRVAQHLPTTGNRDYVTLLQKLNAKNGASKYSALSLFSGCGGLSLGFKWAGFAVPAYVEVSEASRSIYEKNFPNSTRLGSDITALSDDEIENAYKRIGQVDAIIGGPPCQGFSLSGKRDTQDARNILFQHYLRFVRIFRPKIAVMENVRLLTSMKSAQGHSVKNEIEQSFRDNGYRIEAYEINAKDYGIPQHRERIFFVAVRKDLKIHPSFPSPTHGKGKDLFIRQSPYRTFADACSDLPYLESGERSADPLHNAVAHPKHVIDWLWNVEQGKSAHENEDPNMRPPSGYNTTYKRQIWNEPASTLQTTFGMISGCRNVHPIATRSLTIREAARIQSFPDEFQFEGTFGGMRTAIGNAVPPLLGYSVAHHLSGNILDLIKVTGL